MDFYLFYLFMSQGEKVIKSAEKCKRSIIIFILHQMLFGCRNTREWDGRSTFHISGEVGEICLRVFFWRTLKITEGLKDLDVVGEIMFKW